MLSTTETDEAIISLGRQMKAILLAEKVEAKMFKPLVGLSHDMVSRICGKRHSGNDPIGYSIHALLKMTETLGYELIAVKRKDAKSIWDNPDVVQLIAKFKNDEQIKRNKALGHESGVKIKVKPGRPPKRTENIINPISERFKVNQAKRENDIFGESGGL